MKEVCGGWISIVVFTVERYQNLLTPIQRCWHMANHCDPFYSECSIAVLTSEPILSRITHSGFLCDFTHCIYIGNFIESPLKNFSENKSMVVLDILRLLSVMFCMNIANHGVNCRIT